MAGYSIDGGSSHINVTTEELQNRAGDARKKIDTMKNSLKEMKSLMDKTNGYWQGEAGELYRSTYTALNEVLEKGMADLGTYPDKLLEIAGVYVPAEQQNVETASALSAGVI